MDERDKRCGTCRHFEQSHKDPPGVCNWNGSVPICVPPSMDWYCVWPNEGADCPCWEPKGADVRDIGLCVRTQNCLLAEGIATTDQLVAYTAAGLRKVPNLGKATVQEIRKALDDIGMHLKGDEVLKFGRGE